MQDFGRASNNICDVATFEAHSSDLMEKVNRLSERWNAPPSPWKSKGKNLDLPSLDSDIQKKF